MMAGVISHFGKAGYCAYQWALDIYALHFNAAGQDVPLIIESNLLKRALGLHRWETHRKFLQYVADWPNTENDDVLTADEAEAGQSQSALNQHPILGQSALNQHSISTQLGFNSGLILPQWAYIETGTRTHLFIPNFLKSADEYTKKMARQTGKMSGQAPDIVRSLSGKSREEKTREKSAGARARYKSAKPSPAKPAYDHPPVAMAAFLKAMCKEVERMGAPLGQPFSPWLYVKAKLAEKCHPMDIQKTLLAIKEKWTQETDLWNFGEFTLARTQGDFGVYRECKQVAALLADEFEKALSPKVIEGEREAL